MQLLCEFQQVYWQHKYDSGVVDIPFHITFKRDAELKNNASQKFQKPTKKKSKQFLMNYKPMELMSAVVLMLHQILN